MFGLDKNEVRNQCWSVIRYCRSKTNFFVFTFQTSASIKQTHAVLNNPKHVYNEFLFQPNSNYQTHLYQKMLASIMLHISVYFDFNYFDKDTDLNQELDGFFEKTSFSRSNNENQFSEIASKECASYFYGYTLQSFVLTHYNLNEIQPVDLATKVSDLAIRLNILEKKLSEVTKKIFPQEETPIQEVNLHTTAKRRKGRPRKHMLKMTKVSAGNEELTKLPQKKKTSLLHRRDIQNQKKKANQQLKLQLIH